MSVEAKSVIENIHFGMLLDQEKSLIEAINLIREMSIEHAKFKEKLLLDLEGILGLIEALNDTKL